MNVEVVGASLFGANCYVIWPEGASQALVVDPGPGTAEAVAEVCNAKGLDVGAVVLTHGHIDHVWEAARVAGSDVPVLISGPDLFWLDDPGALLGYDSASFGLGPWERPALIEEISSLTFEPVEGIALRMVPTPGHSPGSAIFLFAGGRDDPPMALSGDVVFAGSVGRTDLPGGDEQEMRESLRTLADALDPVTVLLPGHGPTTSWQRELDSNPFVRRARTRR